VGILLTVGLAIAAPVLQVHAYPPVLAQIPGLPAGSGPSLPYGVQRVGLLETTGVYLDGTELFKIASPAVFDRSNPGNQIPVEVRARQIEASLNRLVSSNAQQQSGQPPTSLDPATLQVLIEDMNGQPVLLAQDKTLSEPAVLLTVTDTDATYHGVSQPELAQRWQVILEQELRQSLISRQPEALQRQIRRLLLALFLILLLTVIGLLLWRRLGRRQAELEQAKETQATLLTPSTDQEESPPDSIWLRLQEVLQQQFSLDRRIQMLRFGRWLIFWILLFLWIAGIADTLYHFPQTRRFASSVLSTPIYLLIALFLAGLVDSLTNMGIDRLAKTWQQDILDREEDFQRKSLRVSTVVNVVKGLKTVFVYAIAILWVLQALNLAPTSVLAFGALLALAISFASQSLVKDLVNGFLILVEDQFAIGDFIAIGNVSGFVENLNLRITQIRTDDGRLVTIPNSAIAQVENWTRLWSRTEFVFDVAYETDVQQVLGLVQQVAESLAEDPEIGKFILDPVDTLVLENFSHRGITIRARLRTQPMQRWLVGREFRLRLKLALDRAGIQIGIPQQLVSELLRESEMPKKPGSN